MWKKIEHKWKGSDIELKVPDCVKKEYEDDDIICYPPAQELFTAFNLCHFNKVRVVIIGQDPYPGEGEADGMAFSMKKLKKKNNPKNSIEHYIIPRLKKVYPEGKYSDDCGDLSNWATQGVLLLNSALSYTVPSNIIEKTKVRKEKVLNEYTQKKERFEKLKLKQQEALNSKNTATNKYREAKKKVTNANNEILKYQKQITGLNKEIKDLENKIKKYKELELKENPWEDLIKNVLTKINNIEGRKICFLLWGGNAVNIFNKAVKEPNHIVLTCAHPSPKAEGANFPFSENHHFTTVNLIQEMQKKEKIDWSIPGLKK